MILPDYNACTDDADLYTYIIRVAQSYDFIIKSLKCLINFKPVTINGKGDTI